ncbi:Cation/calcium exchanger 4 -like protein [Gossypium arboreum]|uniref:Cation/calcium exchanger 4-like protein n=1 Tax=Gossypium arboreum TaxID=29729 RepID=A0A0B0NGC2_GOSAR|nr:Cation/calcium exchanger 4 -like protein [Gossypium arboreum]
MKENLLLNANPTSNSSLQFLSFHCKTKAQISFFKAPSSLPFSSRSSSSSFVSLHSSAPYTNSTTKEFNFESNGLPQTSKSNLDGEPNENYNVGIGHPIVPNFIPAQKMSLSDQTFYLFTFIACMVWFKAFQAVVEIQVLCIGIKLLWRSQVWSLQLLDNWMGKVHNAWLSIEAETPDLVAS